MGGKGKGKKGGGGWVFVPASIFGSKGGYGKGKGKSKGKDQFRAEFKKAKDDQKVWVGGLTEEVTWKELKEHFDAVGKTKLIEKLGKAKDTVCIIYANAED